MKKQGSFSVSGAQLPSFCNALALVCRCTLARISWEGRCAEFFACNTNSTPVKDLQDVVPLMVLSTRIDILQASTEQELKNTESALKKQLETGKEFVDRVKAVITATVKAIGTYQSEEVKKEKQKDKVRAQNEKMKLATDKAALKGLRRLCKDQSSPGLLSYCGQMVKEFNTYGSVRQFAEASAQPDFDPSLPYIISDCEQLTKLLGEAAAVTTFSTFKTQLPFAEMVKNRKKCQCPFDTPLTDAVRAAMLQAAYTKHVPIVPAAVVSMWGCKADMLCCGFEPMMLGCLRYTAGGAREVACCSATDLVGLDQAVAEKTHRLAHYGCLRVTAIFLGL